MRLVLTAAIVALLLGVTTPASHAVPAQDPVTTGLIALRTAIATNDGAAFRAMLSTEIPSLDVISFEISLLSRGVTAVTARERDREPISGGTRVLEEFLIERDGVGQIATWQISWSMASGALRITSLRQIASVSGLHRLELDTSIAYTVKNFAFTATDFRLTMATGVGFVAKTADGVTALVLRGSGRMQFEPSDVVERHQLVRYARAETLNDPVDAAFLRINPSEYQTRISDGSLTPMTATSGDINRARSIFNQWAGRSYNIALGDLSAERWTLLPNAGDALADMSTRHFGWLSYSRAGVLTEDVTLFDRINRKNISLYASPAKLATRGRFYNEDDERTFDIEDYELNVRFDPQQTMVSGTARLRLRILRHDADTITIKLAEALKVSSLTDSEYGRLVHLRVVGQDSVIVSFPEPQPIGKIATLSFTYAGRLPPQSLARENAAVTADTPAPQQELALGSELNYVYSTASYWYPQSTVTDYATARIRVSVPEGYQAVSTGSLLSEGPVGTDHVAAYGADRPVRYLSTIIGRFVSLPRSTVMLPSGGTVTPSTALTPLTPLIIDAKSNPRMIGNTRTLTARAADMMTFYASLVGDAPYPSFTLLSLESDLPGGHSPAYFAAINQPTSNTPYTWRNDPIAFDDEFPDYYLAHEVAHQWWGQAVGAKNYHEQWLSEGLAQYFAYLYAGRDRGIEVQRDILERMRRTVSKFNDSGPISLGYRLGHVVGDGTNFRAIVYNKSVVVLDMLRQLIGDEAFAAGLRRFYQERKYQKAGTDDLRQAFETEAKQPLGRFFDQWVMGSGLPTVKLSSVLESSGQAVLLRIEQSGEIFDVPVTVSIAYDNLPTQYVTLRVHGAVTEERVVLKGRVRADRIRLVPGL